MELYLRTIRLLKQYFKQDTEKLFLSGGCFFLATFLHEHIPNTDLVINRELEHCATQISYHGIYDITGKISREHFRYATKRDIQFMQKNYIPEFNEIRVRAYLNQSLRGTL